MVGETGEVTEELPKNRMLVFFKRKMNLKHGSGERSQKSFIVEVFCELISNCVVVFDKMFGDSTPGSTAA